LADLEKFADVHIVTQNVDDLHERAGSTRVMHLHGELRKVRSTRYPELVYDWLEDLNEGDHCARGAQLRPHIVWFGEEVPLIYDAAQLVETADRILVIGSSMQVYPAAGLVSMARADVPVWYIDPHPSINHELQQRKNLTVVAQKAGEALPQLVQSWQKAI
jgi:NAD-dependent deacetylase